MWLRIISLFFVLIAIAAFIFLSGHQAAEIKDQKLTLAKKDDYIKKDSTTRAQQESKNQKLIHIIDSFFSTVNRYDYPNLKKFYADTLKRFYRDYRNISKDAANRHDANNWSEGNERAQFVVSHSPNIVNDTAYVQGVFKSPQKQYPFIFVFQFDGQMKINYIRALNDK